MIVGLNLLYLLPGIVGGTETYAAGLIHGLSRVPGSDRFVVFVNRESADWPLPDDGRFRRVVCPVQAVSRLARYRFEQLELPRRARAAGVELLHSLGYVAPLRLACPSVVTVHDVHYLGYGRWRDWPRRRALAVMVGASVRRAAAVIAVSRYMRGVVARAHGVPVETIDVVWEAANPRLDGGHPASAGAIPAGAPYFLAFGGVTPNKNLERLLQAYTFARRRHGLARRLVLVGRLPTAMQPVNAPGVVATGYLSEPDLAAALRGAGALVFPSLYEGFGLPVLEAMAAGVPVICSDATAIPEVAGPAALYCNPLDVEDMAAKMALMDRDPDLRARLAVEGRRRAASFTWERAATETLAIYRRVAAQAHVPSQLDSPERGGDL